MGDRLTVTHAIEDAGMERAKAERMASAIVDRIHETVATKAEVAAVTGDLKAGVAAVRTDLRRTEGSLEADIAAVRADLVLVKHRMLTRLGDLLAVAVGIILAAIRYLPPVGHAG
jgi:hypothetical protein